MSGGFLVTGMGVVGWLFVWPEARLSGWQAFTKRLEPGSTKSCFHIGLVCPIFAGVGLVWPEGTREVESWLAASVTLGDSCLVNHFDGNQDDEP